jgi:hypothetical protein
VARTFMCILCVIIVAFDAQGSITAGQLFGRWLSFLTNWTWVLCLSVLFPGLVISLYFLDPSRASAGVTPTFEATRTPAGSAAASSIQASRPRSATWMRIYWVMWEMAGSSAQVLSLTRIISVASSSCRLTLCSATLSLTITILYWALVYNSGNPVQFSVSLPFLFSQFPSFSWHARTSPTLCSGCWRPWSERSGTFVRTALISAHPTVRFTSHSQSPSFVTRSAFSWTSCSVDCLLWGVILYVSSPPSSHRGFTSST